MPSTTDDVAAIYSSMLASVSQSRAPSAAAAEFLKFIRHSGVAGIPSEVHDAAKLALASPAHLGGTSSTQYWDTVEQAACAALQAGRVSAGAALADDVTKRFPSSSRAARLQAMVAEARGDKESARAAYAAIRAEHPTNAAAWKRQVAMCKADGDDIGAARALAAYLDVFGADSDAWMEMAELQLALGRAAPAAFALEEVVLASPANPATHTRLAEVFIAVGGRDAYRSARLHAAEAVRLVCGATKVEAGGGTTRPSDAGHVHGAACPWPLAVLADAAYLHWTELVDAKAPPLPVAFVQRNASTLAIVAAASADVLKGVGVAKAEEVAPARVAVLAANAARDAEGIQEDVALHALALGRLEALATGASAEQNGAPPASIAARFPAAVIAAAAGSAVVRAALQRQAALMKAVGEHAAA